MSIRRRSWAVAMRGRARHRRNGPEEPDRSPMDGGLPPRLRPAGPDAPAAGLDEPDEQPDHPEPPTADLVDPAAP
ncbi:hypothetical protein [Kitasatospora cathayae]|uniref:Uncharacterized protein n=1 Tax=Kitasatospora cathayae TaxID=3004092 RepID=A0ABY7PWB6_9ACTN|nr:hypothetical protein [Kitasatospora sp. HUAS 3-15]WBP84487.1 hypothetical protein O1G21_00530 [Kitasatospora sp. HUAS 3-15]